MSKLPITSQAASTTTPSSTTTTTTTTTAASGVATSNTNVTTTGIDSGTGARSKSLKYELEAEHELRFEIPPDLSGVTIVLESGSCEMNGIELAHNRTYPLHGGLNGAVFTWHGATIVLNGDEPEIIDKVMAYTATNTPMPSYINAHAILQSKRLLAKTKGGSVRGPIAMVVGSRDCGKTTLVNTLGAYSIKANGSVMMVDIDASSNGACGIMPGALTTSIATHIDLDVGGIIHENLMCHMLGHVLPSQNRAVSEVVYESMGKFVNDLLTMTTTNNIQGFNGCIIDTSHDVEDKNGIDILIHAIKVFHVDVVFVLGSERLYASIRNQIYQGSQQTNSNTETILLNKSGGVVSTDDSIKLSLQSTKIRQYFYGVHNMFNPFSSVMDFDNVKVFKIGGVISQLSDSLLPIGAESSIDPLKPVLLTSVHDLLHKILGVSQAEKEEDVVTSPVYGFVHVVSVNPSKNTMIVLAPSTGSIPGKYLVAGDIKWIE